MILKLFSVYDRKSKIYQPPFYCHNVGHATRMFTGIFSEPGKVFSAFPYDFEVWESGSYDDQTGMVTPLEKIIYICTAADLLVTQDGVPRSKGEAEDHAEG